MMYWPAMNTIMYSLVSPKFFNLYADSACLIFAGVMSYIAYNNSGTAELSSGYLQGSQAKFLSQEEKEELMHELEYQDSDAFNLGLDKLILMSGAKESIPSSIYECL